MLTQADRRHLLAVARDAIAHRIVGSPILLVPQPDRADLPVPAGLFVTLTKGPHLRGCVGQLEPCGTLEQIVAACAVSAATGDPRFPALASSELPHTTIEISILSPPVRVTGPNDVVLGTHGVIIHQGSRRGLLLPQVGAGHGWTVEKLLSQASRKAGLFADAWRTGATIDVFTAEVFSEEDVLAHRPSTG